MKAVVLRSALLSCIAKIQNVVASKPVLPIAANVLIKAQSGMLTLSVTDFQVSMQASVEAKISLEGEALVPAKRFFSLIRELKDSFIDLELCKNNHLQVKVDAIASFKILGEDPIHFPRLQELGESWSLTVPGRAVKNLLSKVLFAVATDEVQQPILKGIHFLVKDQELTLLGADGKRLSVSSYSLSDEAIEDCSAVWPLKASQELLHLLGAEEEEEDLLIQIVPGKMGISIGSVALVFLLLEGGYPNLRQLIPSLEGLPSFAVDKEALSSRLRQISLFVCPSRPAVCFSLSQEELILWASSGEFGDGKSAIPVRYAGEKIDIALNPRYVLDVLLHSQDEIISFHLASSSQPCLITDSSKTKSVIMPMKLPEMATD